MTGPRSWWARLLGQRSNVDAQGSGEDVALDSGLASSRATGGDHDELSGDRGSTTGTGRTGEFVGRVAGDDLGYAGETGAERRAETLRAEALREHPGQHTPADRPLSGPAPNPGQQIRGFRPV